MNDVTEKNMTTLTPFQQAALDTPDEYLLTVVTINRNNAANLCRTLKSLEQMCNDPVVECIFIDGASTDNSVEIARQFYKSEKLLSEPDTGIYNAMNKGLLRARGKYVLWLNSGDELKPFAWDGIKKNLLENESDLVSFGLEMFKEGYSFPEIVWLPKIEDIPCYTLPHPTTFFNRKSFLKCGGYSENYKIAGDREAILRLYYMGLKFDFSSQVTGVFYFGGASSGFSLQRENLKINKYFEIIKYSEYLFLLLKLEIKAALNYYK